MRILIVSEYIAPFQSVASIRWSKIAKYLKKLNPEIFITVLTNQKNYISSNILEKSDRKDELLEKDLIFFDKYIEVPNNYFVKTYNKIKAKNQKRVSDIVYLRTMKPGSHGISFLKEILLELIHDLKEWLLFFQERKIACKEALNYDVVITSYGPIWTHLIGESIKKANSKIIWVADFRDPYAKEGESKWSYNRHKRFTMKHLNLADMITRVNNMIPTYTSKNIPVHTVSNGYDPEERLKRVPPSKFTLVFTGTLCGKNSNIGIVCKALLDLCAEGKMDETDIEVSYAGAYGRIAKSLAAEYQAERILHDFGVLKRQDALKMQQTSAILLLAAENTEREKSFWTGKTYEYMMAQKPILYVIAGDVPNSKPSKYIHLLGGYCYEQCRHEETYQGMKDYILEKYREWKATGDVTVQQDQEYIKQFAYPHIAEQVWQLIQEGMMKRNENGTLKEN